MAENKDQWVDMLIRSDAQSPDDLAEIFHKSNPKIHPRAQTEALKGAIGELGWMSRPKVNLRTSDQWGDEKDVPVLIDGHDRIKAAIEEDQELVPVDYYDLTPNQERLFLITHDPIGMMAQHDRVHLENLLHDTNTGDENLMQFLSDLAEENNIAFGDNERADEHDPYTKVVEIPTYTPTGEKPEPQTLYNDTKAQDLIAGIEALGLPENEMRFLVMAAYRHVVFDYKMIAEYYAHSSAEVQELMENSALVIIDFNKAIANGFVQLTKDIEAILELEYGDD